MNNFSLHYVFTQTVTTTKIILNSGLVEDLAHHRASISSIFKLSTILYYAGHILAAYASKAFFDIFMVNSTLEKRVDISQFFFRDHPAKLEGKLRVAPVIEFIEVPRLDWQDR